MHRNQSERDSEAAFVAIYHRHSAAVMGYALRRCGADDAADVVAETFVVAWRRLDDIPEEPAVKPWLFGVARRVLANQRRGLRRRGELVRKVSTYMAPRFYEVAGIENFGEAETIVEALNQLPIRDRELLMLVAWEQLNPAEIAVTLGVSGSVVRKRLFRARQRLAAAADQVDKERAGRSGHLLEKGDQESLRMGKGAAAQ